MTIDPKDLQKIIEGVAVETEGLVEITPAFTLECANYTRRMALTDLDRAELTVVVEGLTRRALSKKPSRLDAHAFRVGTLELCNDPWGLCDEAAITILEDRQMHGAVKKIRSSLTATLAALKT